MREGAAPRRPRTRLIARLALHFLCTLSNTSGASEGADGAREVTLPPRLAGAALGLELVAVADGVLIAAVAVAMAGSAVEPFSYVSMVTCNNKYTKRRLILI
jgi:hypothetical protein